MSHEWQESDGVDGREEKQQTRTKKRCRTRNEQSITRAKRKKVEELGQQPPASEINNSDGEEKKRKRERAEKRRQDKERKLKNLLADCRETPVLVGLDLSLNSSAMAILDRRDAKRWEYTVVCFAQRKWHLQHAQALSVRRPTHLPRMPGGSFRVLLQPVLPEDTTKKMVETSDVFVHHLRRFKRDDVTVVAEDYLRSEMSENTNSLTQLCEVTGVVKSDIWRHCRLRVHPVSNSKIKKWFTGFGNATKECMWSAFRALKIYDLLQYLPRRRKSTAIGAADADTNPHSDIVDAFAIAHALAVESSSCRDDSS